MASRAAEWVVGDEVEIVARTIDVTSPRRTTQRIVWPGRILVLEIFSSITVTRRPSWS